VTVPRALKSRFNAALAGALAALGIGLAALDSPAQDGASFPPPVPDAPIAAPADHVAAKAFAVLDRHCASCHQTGRLKRASPAGGLANILRLEELARLSTVVQPGNPDGSRLVNHMMRREMPFDVYHEGATREPPTGEDIDSIRAWISALPPRQACEGRRPVLAGDVAEAIAAAAAKAGAGAKSLRFVSIANLYNNCLSDQELAAARMAVVRLVNGLTWKSERVPVTPVDPQGTLLQVSLDDLGWVQAHWEMILYAYPYGFMQDSRAARQAAELLGTALPVVRADWLAYAAGRAPLYYDLLGLPTQSAELWKVVKINPEKATEERLAKRGGVVSSLAVTSERLLERYPSPSGSLWMSYEIPMGATPRLLEAPVPGTPPSGFRHELSLVLFSLPNGLPASFIAEAGGTRLDALPGGVLRSKSLQSRPMPAGAACLGCHELGPRNFRDDVRANIVGDARFSAELQALVAALHPPLDELERLIAGDAAQVAKAMRNVGVDPGVRLVGHDLINGLARLYLRDVDLERLAGELGVPASRLIERSEGRDADLRMLVLRLQQGLVSRPEIEAQIIGLAELADLARPVAFAGQAALPSVIEGRGADADIGLVLLADKPVYRAGDLATFTIKTKRDCFLTVINLDVLGRATVIFPNEFEQSNRITAGRELRLPGERAPYQLRAKQRGRERMIAICNTAGPWAEGIVHDYERQRFTVLGDYSAYLSRGAGSEIVGRSAPAPRPVDRRGIPVPKRRQVPQGTEGDPRPPPEALARTGIVIEIQ